MKKIITLFLVFIVAFVSASCDDSTREGQAKTPSASSSQKGRNYQDVIDVFKKKGFTNIRTEVLDDLITGWLTKDGEVKSVSVDGNEDYKADVWYPNDVEIIITYHTFPVKETIENISLNDSSSTGESNDDLTNVTLHEISVDVPAGWRKEAQENSGFFLYPKNTNSDGFLYIGVRKTNGRVPDDLALKRTMIENIVDYTDDEDFIRNDLVEYDLRIAGCYAAKNISIWKDYSCIYYYILTNYNLYLIGIDIYENSPPNLEDILESVIDSVKIIVITEPITEPPTIAPTTEKPTEPPTTEVPAATETTTSLNGYHSLTYDNGDKYVGNFVNGVRSGQGKYEWANGTIYDGEFIDGNPSGDGNYIYPTEAPTEPLRQGHYTTSYGPRGGEICWCGRYMSQH